VAEFKFLICNYGINKISFGHTHTNFNVAQRWGISRAIHFKVKAEIVLKRE